MKRELPETMKTNLMKLEFNLQIDSLWLMSEYNDNKDIYTGTLSNYTKKLKL